METINNLSAIPRQTIKSTIGDYEYTIRIMYCDSFLAYDLSIDNEEIVSGFRIVYGQLLHTLSKT